jgi:hypothetical protein
LNDGRYELEGYPYVILERDLIKATEGEFEEVVEEIKKDEKKRRVKRNLTKELIADVDDDGQVEFYPDILSREKKKVDVKEGRVLRPRKKINYKE